MSNDAVGIENNNFSSQTKDEKVKVTSLDNTAEFLSEKIIEGGGISVDVIDLLGKQQIVISSDATTLPRGGSEEIVKEFSYSDGENVLVGLINPEGAITKVRVIIDSAYPSGADIEVFVSTSISPIMQADEIDSTIVADYEINSFYGNLPALTAITLRQQIAGVNQGSGKVVVYITR